MTAIAGKIAFVTGGAGAIGSAIAIACAGAGTTVAIADRDQSALTRAVDRFRDIGVQVLAVPLDVTSPEQWQDAVERVERELGSIQLLFNNAGVSALGTTIDEMPPDYWQRVMSINVTSIVLSVQTVVRRMRTLGLDGHVVNTSSVAGLGLSVAGGGAYVMSKAAVVALSEVLELELGDVGIGLSVLCPGPVRSELWRTSREPLNKPPLDAPPAASRRGSAAPDAMDPAIVGRMVVDGVIGNRFFIVTHRDVGSPIKARHARLQADLENR